MKLAAAALLFAPALASAAPAPDDADFQACKTGHEISAISACQRVIDSTSTPKDRELAARHYQAVLQIVLGQTDLGIRNLTLMIERDPKDENAYGERAIGYGFTKDYAKAFADIDTAMKLAPGKSNPFYIRCNLYLEQHLLDKALADCDRAEAIYPSDVTLVRRGVVHLARRELDAAFADFNAALERNPKSADALMYRAMAYSRKGDHEHVLADHRQAAALAPGDDRVLGALMLDYLIADRGDEAAAEFDALVRQAPNEAAPYYYRAEVNETAGRPMAQIIADETMAIRLAPEQARYRWVRGLDYEKVGDYAAAAEDIGNAVRLDSSKPVYRAQHCVDLAWADKDLDTALGECNEALRLDGHSWEALSGRGFVALRQKRYAPALADFNARIENQNPTDKTLTQRAIGVMLGAIPPEPRGSVLGESLAEAFCGRALTKKGLGDKAGADTDMAAADEADADTAKKCRKLFGGAQSKAPLSFP